MKTFFKSGRYLLWLAAAAIMVGAGSLATSFHEAHGSDDAGIGAALLAGGMLVWLRASKQEKRFEKSQKQPVAVG